MDVSVHHKRGQRLSSVSRPSVLGDGLLERARATSLGLLGVTAAVGLAIAALAYNQAWPLVAGGPVPPLPPRHQGVGEATVAAGAGTDSRPEAAEATGSSRKGGGGEKARREGSRPPTGGSSPAPSSEFVVAPPAPAKVEGDAPSGGSRPDPASAKPKQAAPSPVQPPTAEPQPSSPAPAVTEPEPPPASVSEAPTSSSVPPWSNGRGHAYGRGDDGDDDYDDDDDHDDGHGHDDDD